MQPLGNNSWVSGSGCVPGRRAADADVRRPLRSAIRIAQVAPRHGPGEQRAVGNAPGQNSHGIKALGHELHAEPVDHPVARLVAHHATERCRPDHAARGLRAVGEREEALRNARRRSAARPTRRVPQVARVGGRARFPGGKLGGDGLSDHHPTRLPSPGDGGGIGPRLPAAPDRGAIFTRHVSGIQHVLHANRQSMQRPRHERSSRFVARLLHSNQANARTDNSLSAIRARHASISSTGCSVPSRDQSSGLRRGQAGRILHG